MRRCSWYGAIANDEAEAIESSASSPRGSEDGTRRPRLAGISDELVESVNAAYAGGEFEHAAKPRD